MSTLHNAVVEFLILCTGAIGLKGEVCSDIL